MAATDLDSTSPASEKVLSDSTGGAATGRNFVLNTRPQTPSFLPSRFAGPAHRTPSFLP